MKPEHKLLIGIGIGALMFAPIWKVGRKKGVSLAEALWKHTIFADSPEEQMCEECYREDVEKLGVDLIEEKY